VHQHQEYLDERNDKYLDDYKSIYENINKTFTKLH